MSKADKIRDMYSIGKNMKEIAKELDSHYSYVYAVCSKIDKEATVKPSTPTPIEKVDINFESTGEVIESTPKKVYRWILENYSKRAMMSQELTKVLNDFEEFESKIPNVHEALKEAELLKVSFDDPDHPNYQLSESTKSSEKEYIEAFTHLWKRLASQ